MAKGDGILPIVLAITAGAGGLWAWKTGAFRNFMQPSPQRNIAELKLRLKGFHANSDGSVLADIEALNPTSIAFQVQSIIGNFYVAGQRVGEVKMFGDQVLRPNDDATIPVNVRVMPQSLYMWRKRGNRVQFQGKINLNNNILPLTMNYQL